MSMIDDLARHAADKVQRAIEDVIQLADDRSQEGTILMASLSRMMAMAGVHYANTEGLSSADGEFTQEVVNKSTLVIIDRLRQTFSEDTCQTVPTDEDVKVADDYNHLRENDKNVINNVTMLSHRLAIAAMSAVSTDEARDFVSMALLTGALTTAAGFLSQQTQSNPCSFEAMQTSCHEVLKKLGSIIKQQDQSVFDRIKADADRDQKPTGAFH